MIDIQGNRISTPYYDDFCTSEFIGGSESIREYFDIVFNDKKNDFRYLSELGAVLHRLERERGYDQSFVELYHELSAKVDDYAKTNLSGDSLIHYRIVTA